MPDPFRKWAQGDEFAPSAAQLNAWTDAARFAQQSLNRGAPVAPIGGQHFTSLRMRNNTGDVIPPLGVVGFSLPMVLPSVSEARFIHDLVVDAELPTDPLDRFAISLQQVSDGALFIAAVGGVIPCRVTGTGAKVLSLDGDVGKLEAGASGHDLVWSEAGSSERFGIVRLGAGAGATCARTYDLRILWNPASGNCTIGVRYNSVTETIAFARNATHSHVIDLINAHSEFVFASVTASFAGAGSFPSANMVVRFPSGAEIVSHSDTLVSSGGSPVAEFRVDVCGC